jgi:hypothetical protein
MRKFPSVFLLLIGLAVLGVASSCHRDRAPLEFVYEEQVCGNPWGERLTGQSLESYEHIIGNYLAESLDVVFFDINVEDPGLQPACLACTCVTGVRVFVLSNEASRDALLAAGFREN